MAKVKAGLLGHFSGKIGGAVGGQWKNVSYARAYVKPANPNTDAQKAKRSRFKLCALFCQGIVGLILNSYMDPFLRGMSGYNWALKTNIALFPDLADVTLAKICHGPLFPAVPSVALDTVGVCAITFATGIGPNGKTTDLVYACVYNNTTGVWTFAPAEVLRSAGTISVTMDTETEMDKTAFLVTCRRNASTAVTLVSDSQSIPVTSN
jgi:hypothetical protein